MENRAIIIKSIGCELADRWKPREKAVEMAEKKSVSQRLNGGQNKLLRGLADEYVFSEETFASREARGELPSENKQSRVGWLVNRSPAGLKRV